MLGRLLIFQVEFFFLCGCYRDEIHRVSKCCGGSGGVSIVGTKGDVGRRFGEGSSKVEGCQRCSRPGRCFFQSEGEQGCARGEGGPAGWTAAATCRQRASTVGRRRYPAPSAAAGQTSASSQGEGQSPEARQGPAPGEACASSASLPVVPTLPPPSPRARTLEAAAFLVERRDGPVSVLV